MARVYIDIAFGAGGFNPIPLPDVKYIGAAPGTPVTVDPRTEEVEMSDKSRRLAFFDDVKRELPLGWGYLTKAELDVLLMISGIKNVMRYKNDFEDPATWYEVYVVSFTYEFVRSGIRKLQRFRAEMVLRQA